jgi:hypothetical protein
MALSPSVGFILASKRCNLLSQFQDPPLSECIHSSPRYRKSAHRFQRSSPNTPDAFSFLAQNRNGYFEIERHCRRRQRLTRRAQNSPRPRRASAEEPPQIECRNNIPISKRWPLADITTPISAKERIRSSPRHAVLGTFLCCFLLLSLGLRPACTLSGCDSSAPSGGHRAPGFRFLLCPSRFLCEADPPTCGC